MLIFFQVIRENFRCRFKEVEFRPLIWAEKSRCRLNEVVIFVLKSTAQKSRCRFNEVVIFVLKPTAQKSR